MFENNMEDVYQRLSKIFNRGDFKTNFNAISNNWLELPIEEVTQNILIYISEFSIKV